MGGWRANKIDVPTSIINQIVNVVVVVLIQDVDDYFNWNMEIVGIDFRIFVVCVICFKILNYLLSKNFTFFLYPLLWIYTFHFKTFLSFQLFLVF